MQTESKVRPRRAVARLLAALALAAAAAVTVGCTPQITVAPATSAGERILTVIGQGEARGRPDIARAALGVEATAPSVVAATRDAAARMQAILAALRAKGVADVDVHTESFQIGFERLAPEQRYYPEPAMAPSMGPTSEPRAAAMPAPPPGPAQGPAGYYRVSQMVRVTIRDLAAAGSLIDAAVGAGANQMYDIGFALDDPRPLGAKAREAAIADAKARAEQLAALAGLTLGNVLVVDESPARGGMPTPMPMMAKMEASASTPIAAGEIAATAEVQVVYSIR